MTAQLQEFLSLYMDEPVDAQAQRLLSDYLARNPAERGEALAYVRLHGAITLIADRRLAGLGERVVQTIRLGKDGENLAGRVTSAIRDMKHGETSRWKRSVAWALPVAAAIAVAAGAWWMVASGTRSEEASVAESLGCQVQNAERHTRVASAGDRIRAGERLTTIVGGHGRLVLGDGSIIEINGDTTLAVQRLGKSNELTLDKGEIFVQAKSRMRLNPGRFDEVANMGTAFELSRTADGTVTLRVAAGQVRFGLGNAAIEVAALQASSVEPNGTPGKPISIALADIARWRTTAGGSLPAGTIYEDDFAADTLGPFWVKADPPDCVKVGQKMLELAVKSDGKTPRTTQVVSQPAELDGRPVMVELTRNRGDGAKTFLPLDENTELRIDLVDESGRAICRTVWWTRRDIERRGDVGTVLVFAAGDEPLKWAWAVPSTARFFVSPDGQVRLMLDNTALLGTGAVDRNIRSVSVRLSLKTQGTEEVKVRWTKALVRRLDKWPEFPKDILGAEYGAGTTGTGKR